MTPQEFDAAVSDLIRAKQYRLTYAEKRDRLLPLLAAQSKACIDAIPALARYMGQLGISGDVTDYTDLPYLPVSAFKQFKLSAVSDDQIVRILQSSATTTGIPSKVYLDKITSFRQSRALAATMADILGTTRKPYLVLDSEAVVKPGTALTARGAAIRGLDPFASSRTFALVNTPGSSELTLDLPAFERFFQEHADKDVFVFGFTFMVWSNVVRQLQARGLRFKHPRLILLHSGGWKTLTAMQVDAKVFAAGVTDVFGCEPSAVRDFYGMVEQVGVVFVDCEAGHKHSPDFAEVSVRDFTSLKQVPAGGSGLIQVMSALPSSYPGQALLTEDVGTVIGFDDCPCGRKGIYFKFRSRVAKAEVRGCGDTVASSRAVVVSTPSAVASLASADLQPAADVTLLCAPSLAPDLADPFASWRRQWLSSAETRARMPTAAIVALLDAAAQQMVSEEFRGIPGIAFLATWLRKRSIEKVIEGNFGGEIGALEGPVTVAGQQLRAAPRGIVAHWVAGNVPTLPVFSWALAALAKNASVIRVAQRSQSTIKKLFAAVERSTATVDGVQYAGRQLMEATAVVYFPSGDETRNRQMSLNADARVIWGGSEALASILSLPRLEHCEDLIFGPKFSIAVMDQALCGGDAKVRSGAVAALVRDVLAFEQRACSSPQVLFVESASDAQAILNELAAAFESARSRAPKEPVDEATSSAILRARASYGLRPDAEIRAARDLSYSILMDHVTEIPDAIQDRTLFLKVVADVRDVIPLLSPKIQSIGIGIADPAKRAEFCERAILRGVSRCTPLGTMNIYETPWDGMKPINRLVRWCKVID